MSRSIQFDGTNEQQVSKVLGRECWIKCSGDLAVQIMPKRLCDQVRVSTVPIDWWVRNTDAGIETQDKEF